MFNNVSTVRYELLFYVILNFFIALPFSVMSVSAEVLKRVFDNDQ